MRLTALPVATLLLSSCATQPDPKFVADVQKWRAERETRLRADDGWLTLVGLFWIEEGVSKIGSDPGSDVPLPAPLPKELGSIVLTKGEARFEPTRGVALKPTVLHDDNKPNYEVVTLDSVSFYLIERGGRLLHVDVTIICERPKVGPHRGAMVARIAELLALPADRVSVKATTTEQLGFTGRGEGIAAQATATILMP